MAWIYRCVDVYMYMSSVHPEREEMLLCAQRTTALCRRVHGSVRRELLRFIHDTSEWDLRLIRSELMSTCM